jgi:hypothetical protein
VITQSRAALQILSGIRALLKTGAPSPAGNFFDDGIATAGLEARWKPQKWRRTSPNDRRIHRLKKARSTSPMATEGGSMPTSARNNNNLELRKIAGTLSAIFRINNNLEFVKLQIHLGK